MITLRGVALVATAGFTFLLARLTDVGWLYLLDALLWGMVLLSAALPWLAVASLRAGLRVIRSAGQPGPAEGQAVQLELTVGNGRAWPRYLLSASYHCPLAEPEARWRRFFVHHLPGHGSVAINDSVECYRRGLHHFSEVIVESKGPFGLFRRRRRLPASLSVLAYPQVSTLKRLPLVDGTQGTHTRPLRTRVGQEIAGTRSYVPGDPLRHIHWRNTAWEGRPMLKEFEDSQENTLIISFDSSADSGEGRETVLEYSIKLAASVAGYVAGRGGGVRLLTGALPDQELLWPDLLKELALLEVKKGPGMPALVDSLPDGARLLALVSEADSEGIEAIRRRAGQLSGLAVVVLEGFEQAPSPRSESVLGSLRIAEATVVSCRRGQLQEAFRSLESTWSFRRGDGYSPRLVSSNRGGDGDSA